MAERMPTAKTPSSALSIQPMGAAYQPRGTGSHGGDDQLVLVAILGRGQQRRGQRLVLVRRLATGGRTGQGHRRHGAAGQADQQLRRRAEKGVMGARFEQEAVAVTVVRIKIGQRRGGIDGGRPFACGVGEFFTGSRT